ncbi:MAG: NAD(P)H-binding protein [Actinobacteria bacterium]|nr:NAD(P)H-binding protein [Actinomycetota bacterium]
MTPPDAPTSAAGPIAVVGAGGPTGRAVLGAFAEAGLASRALVHRADQEAEVLAAGASEAAVIELDDAATFPAALEGAAAIHFIPPVFKARESDQATALLAAAAAAGVERLVMHSVLHADTPGLRHHERKSRTEAIVRASDSNWTILRPAMYAQTMRFYWEKSPDGVVVVPYSLDTPFTPVDLRDVAAAGAIVHGSDGHAFATYELAGSEVLSTREMMAQLAAALGVEFELERGDLADLTLPRNWSEESRLDMAAMCHHYDEVGLAGNGRVLTMLLGRKPTRFSAAIAGGDDRPWA